MGCIATVCYRAKPGKEEALHALCATHYARLYVQGFVSRRLPVFMTARDGTVVQVLEWKSQHAIEAARHSPRISELRGEYQDVSDLVPLASLSEAAGPLALFDSAPFGVALPPFHKVYNHVQVDERISTSGVITAAVVEEIAREGYSGVINLLPESSPYALADEASRARANALAYHYIPVDFAAPTRDDYAAFERALSAFDPEQRVYVHCAANMRVSAFMAIYGVRHMGWSAERAQQHIAEVWEPNEIWRTFLSAELSSTS
ncbi:MAG TPA: protein tyrosine phosphatase family protein [Polyangiales bacterium]|nr:protein tyrosine phosphatase family protein [Polyangiales bacterium]